MKENTSILTQEKYNHSKCWGAGEGGAVNPFPCNKEPELLDWVF